MVQTDVTRLSKRLTLVRLFWRHENRKVEYDKLTCYPKIKMTLENENKHSCSYRKYVNKAAELEDSCMCIKLF